MKSYNYRPACTNLSIYKKRNFAKISASFSFVKCKLADGISCMKHINYYGNWIVSALADHHTVKLKELSSDRKRVYTVVEGYSSMYYNTSQLIEYKTHKKEKYYISDIRYAKLALSRERRNIKELSVIGFFDEDCDD